MTQNAISFTQLYCLSGFQPRFELPRIAQLADIHGRHKFIVTHIVARIRECRPLSG